MFLVWEIYGLTPSELDGRARYTIELKGTQASDSRSGVINFLSSVKDLLFGRAEEGTLRFERDEEIRERRVLEWMRVDFPDVEREQLELVLTIEDLSTGASATRELTLSTGGCEA